MPAAGGSSSSCTAPPPPSLWESLGSPRWVCAPMVEQSERAFRRCCALHGEVRLSYTPMIHARAFVEDPGYRAAQQLGPTPEEAPVVAQICIGPDDVPYAARAARLLSETTCVSAVDLNMGCPQSNAAKHCYGAYLPLASAVQAVREMCAAGPLPVTAKIRIEADEQLTHLKARSLIDAGASALAIHGRTRDQIQGATGTPDWGCLKRAVSHIREYSSGATAVICNGGVLCSRDAAALLSETGCDAVMLGEALLWDFALLSQLGGGAATSLPSGRLFLPHVDAEARVRSAGLARLYLGAVAAHPPTLYQARMHLLKLLHPCISRHPLAFLQVEQLMPRCTDPRIRTVTPGGELQLHRGLWLWGAFAALCDAAESGGGGGGGGEDGAPSGASTCLVENAALLAAAASRCDGDAIRNIALPHGVRLIPLGSVMGDDEGVAYTAALEGSLEAAFRAAGGGGSGGSAPTWPPAEQHWERMKLLGSSDGGCRPLMKGVPKVVDVTAPLFRRLMRVLAARRVAGGSGGSEGEDEEEEGEGFSLFDD